MRLDDSITKEVYKLKEEEIKSSISDIDDRKRELERLKEEPRILLIK